jgi:hypothetical protein
MRVSNIDNQIPPALLVKCACEDKVCPNKILWINKDRLYSHSSGDDPAVGVEVRGLVPIAYFSPSDLVFLQGHFLSFGDFRSRSD